MPNPPFYDEGNTDKGITWFKTKSSEDMLNRLIPLMEILNKYGVEHDIVYTDFVKKIVYKDDYQVAVQ